MGRRRAPPQPPPASSAPPAREPLVGWLLRVPAALKADVEDEAERRGMPAAELARLLLRNGLDDDGGDGLVRLLLEVARSRGLSRDRLAALVARYPRGSESLAR